MSEDATTRELLLQLNHKLTDFIATSSADRATLNAYVEAIKNSVAVLNHNSTSMDARIKNLEETQLTHDAITKYIDTVKDSGRNWVIITCGVLTTLVAILTYFHL